MTSHPDAFPATSTVLRSTAPLSVVIPALNEASNIESALGPLMRSRYVREAIVVDGGSRDDTAAVARQMGARVLRSPRGRGRQMAAGAAVATGEILWFLHADTVPAIDAADAIAASMRDPRLVGGNCSLRFAGDQRAARFMTWLYPQLRRFGLLYGDSGIFARRAAYERCGGFRSHPIFEDLDLVRRLRKTGELAHLTAVVTTSSRRFESRSFPRTFAFWSLLQALYWLGVPPSRLGRLYYPTGSQRHAPNAREANFTLSAQDERS